MPRAVALARTFLTHHPTAQATVVVADAAGTLPPIDGIALVRGTDLGVPSFEVLAAALAPDELATALAPWALAGAPRPAVWLAGDAVVLTPLEVGTDGGLIVRADERTVVDGAFAVAQDARAGAVIRAWQTTVDQLGAMDPVAQLLARSSDVVLERRATWGVAPDNAAERGIRTDGQGRLVLPDGTPVAWARVGPGVVPEVLLSVRAFRDAQAPELALAAGFEVTADATPLDERLRRLFTRAVRHGDLTASPFSAEGWEAFQAWLREPDPTPDGGGLGRYLLDVWRSRADLRTAYPDLHDAATRAGLVSLIATQWDSGGHPPALRPEVEVLAAATGPVGVNIAGYFQSEVGVGEAARRVIAALDAAHVPLLPVQGSTAPPSRRREGQSSTSLATAPFDVNLVCVNADGLPRFAQEAGPDFFLGRRTIGLWWWELPGFPERFRKAFDYIDEVWVGSRHVQDAISAVAPVPVVQMPLAVVAPPVTPMTREELGLPAGFLALFMFDFHSVMGRKNPLGLIEAFERAFGDDLETQLVIKCVNGEHHPAAAQELELAALRRPNTHLLRSYVSAATRDAMLASCDVYASLHRSEGFGLTLAEAMALGRPTVATGWSGNLEFMSEDTSWLVPYELVPVGPGHAPYDPDDHWAEPDLDAAAAAFSEIRADPEAAAERAARGAARIAARHAPVVVGEVMRERLEALRPQIARTVAEGRKERRATLLVELQKARARAARGPEDFLTAGSRSSRALRRLASRALRPAVANQQASDALVLDAIEGVAERLTDELEAMRSAQASLAASLLLADRTRERGVSALMREDAAPD